MIIIGEKINTSRKQIAKAVMEKDSDFIIDVAKKQVEAGANYIDVNAGTFVDNEADYLVWLVKTVQNAIDIPLCIDSPNPEAIAKALEHHKGIPMINSISLEEERFNSLLPVITSQPCKIIALCMDKNSMPITADERVDVAVRLVNKLKNAGIEIEDIYVDPLIQPISVNINMGVAVLEAIKRIMNEFPGINTICGLSNISYGLPARKVINRNFLILAISSGISGAILDPTDKKIMANLLVTKMLLGQDQFCMNFINAYQQGNIKKS